MGIQKFFDKFRSDKGPGPRAPLGEQHVFRYRKQQGVNLGAWFINEGWMSTEAFFMIRGEEKWKRENMGTFSETDICKAEDAKNQLEKHWDNWITDADWQFLIDHGYNTVRLPIGYFHLAGPHPDVLQNTEFEGFAHIYKGAWERIEKAIAKAGEYGLGIIIDLHGVAGAANSQVHSGTSSHMTQLWDWPNNVHSTKLALRYLAEYLAPIPHVIGLELLNEPEDKEPLKGFYTDMVKELQEVAGDDFPLYLHDAFQPEKYYEFFSKLNGFVVYDYHFYRSFESDEERKKRSGYEWAADIRSTDDANFARYSAACGGSISVGEWSSSLAPESRDRSDGARGEFVRAQLELFDKHCAGWIWWSLKTDNMEDSYWNVQGATKKGVMWDWAGGKIMKPHQPDEGEVGRKFKEAYDSHVDWWNAHPAPNAKYEHDRYRTGLEQGFRDATMFFNFKSGAVRSTSKLGFMKPWLAARKEEHQNAKGRSDYAWEFEHGFTKGVAIAEELCLI